MKTESVPPSPADRHPEISGSDSPCEAGADRHPEIAPHKQGALENLHPNWLDCFKSERDRLVLLPRSPSSIFAYWEWTPSRTEAFRNSSLKGELILKLFNAEDKTPAAAGHPEISGSGSQPSRNIGKPQSVRHPEISGSGSPTEGGTFAESKGSPAAVCVAEFPCMWDSLKMYIKPPERGRDYYAALFIRTAAGDFQTLLKSNTVQVPAGKPAGASDSVPGTGYAERFKKP